MRLSNLGQSAWHVTICLEYTNSSGGHAHADDIQFRACGIDPHQSKQRDDAVDDRSLTTFWIRRRAPHPRLSVFGSDAPDVCR